MQIYRFEVKEKETWKDYYAITEGGAKEFKKMLDKNGEDYTMSSYDSLYTLIENLPEWNDDTYSDGEMIDVIMKVISRIGL